MQPSTLNFSDQIASQFNRAASTYDEVAVVQYEVGLLLLNEIKKYGDCFSNIIDLGCGTGFITKKITEQINYQQLHAIDIAENLLIKAEERLKQYNVKCYNKNFNDTYPFDQYSLIFSNFALHWTDNFYCTLQNIKRHLKNDGIFAMTIPLLGTYDTLPNIHKNKFYGLEETIYLLKAIGFKKIESKIVQYTTCFSNFILALKTIKAMGANYLDQHRVGANQLFALRSSLNNRHEFVLNYRVGFFIVQNSLYT